VIRAAPDVRLLPWRVMIGWYVVVLWIFTCSG